jgi:hypothetical protein
MSKPATFTPKLSVNADPGNPKLSIPKLAHLDPEACPPNPFLRLIRRFSDKGYSLTIEKLEKHMLRGSCHPAFVVAINPRLLVSAYSDELDCVLMLSFPSILAKTFSLAVGSRLLAVIHHRGGDMMEKDLIPGPNMTSRHANFTPLIADFLSDDKATISYRKKEIEEAEWQRAKELSEQHYRDYPKRYRDGRPRKAGIPVE